MMDDYITYESRLASFQKTSKKRGSAAGGRSKVLNWPHKQLEPASLAKAGFYFDPYPENPDNCVCFLCGKGLDGWETGDDPLEEHLKHAPHCGWAITAAIGIDVEQYSKQDPTLPHMVEARKATFDGKWPHEGKKGWKCKTKQLVEAGWSYTPTDESDDMATCAYCQLALDGWEPGDKPHDEHINRSPECAFFALLNQFGATKKKKTTRGKAARGSKTSRLSTQSTATAMSEVASIPDVTVEPEESVLTTTSKGGKKKGNSKKKKAGTATAKGGKSISKKTQVVTMEEERGEKEPGSDHEESSTQTKATRSRAGKKRTSDNMDDSATILAEGPALKRKALTVPESSQVDVSTIASTEVVDLTDAPQPRGRTGDNSNRSHRAPSTSFASMASLRAPPMDFPDDDEIERQLEADLERLVTDDEITHDSDSERSMTRSRDGRLKVAAAQLRDYAMFDPVDPGVDDASVDEQLKALQAEMRVEEPEQEDLGSDNGSQPARETRPTSKGSKATRVNVASPSPELVVEQKPIPVKGELKASQRNTEKLVQRAGPAEASLEKASKSSPDLNDISHSTGAAKRGRGRPPKAAPGSSQQPISPGFSNVRVDKEAVEVHEDVVEYTSTPGRQEASRRPQASCSPSFARSRLMVGEAPSTPSKVISPAPSARQPALSPSQSPQSSDAENQPPSSLPTASAKAKRLALAPVAATPSHTSPSKRKMLAAGLQSETPWTAVDLDAVLGSPLEPADKDDAVARLLKQGKDLSSPEKRMTVEEWIYLNAGEAEKKLKHECEVMVTRFEKEGTRAMGVLEGLSLV